jgi:hypothetical protein
MNKRVVLTGGPGGGKTTLIRELAEDPATRGHFLALPEAVFVMRHFAISPQRQLFQRVMVHLQMALEDGLDRPGTGTTWEDHYRRYAGVIHLVTAADGAEDHYAHWPEAHRPEQIEDAIRLDGLLHRVWRDHPCYYRIDNAGRGWTEKPEEARQTLEHWVAIDLPCSDDKRAPGQKGRLETIRQRGRGE